MKREIYLILIACLSCSMAWSQTRQVTGQVTSESNREALAGVSVTLKGTSTISVTDAQGHYSIAVPQNGNAVLVFSSIGFSTVEASVTGRSTVNVELGNSAAALDVVVIGYQTVRRRDLTGSVSSVNARQLKDIPVNSAAEALAGRLAGVQVTGTEGT